VRGGGRGAGARVRPGRIRLGGAGDSPGEGWPGMALLGEMILAPLEAGHPGAVAATRIRPAFRRRLTRWPVVGRGGSARNADRLLNRFWNYPPLLGRLARRGGFDLFHLVRPSYPPLLLPPPARLAPAPGRGAGPLPRPRRLPLPAGARPRAEARVVPRHGPAHARRPAPGGVRRLRQRGDPSRPEGARPGPRREAGGGPLRHPG